MALETSTYISGLVSANPLSTDPKSQGDDHLRLIKSTILNTFPNITGAVTATQTELNYVSGVTSAIQTQLNAKYQSGGALGTPASGNLSNCTGAVAELSSITAASTTATIANAANVINWNWKLTGASGTGFNISETTASTGGAGGQWLHTVGTLASSTANPFRVRSRGYTNCIAVDYQGAVTIESLNGATAGISTGSPVTITAGSGPASGVGGLISMTAGQGTGGFSGGAITINGGSAATNAAGGAVTITAGACASGTGAGGAATLEAGAAGPSGGTGGAVTVKGGNTGATGAATGGAVNITAGSATAGSNNGGDIVLTTGTGTATNGRVNFVNTNVANGSVATAMSSVGPTGASTSIQGWLAIKVNGVSRFIPFW